MIVDLEVPFTDTSVSGLRYLPSAPALPVLAELDHPDLVPDGHLSLRLLGASHQAVLTLPHGQYAETLACVDGEGERLPVGDSVPVGPWRCRLTCTVAHGSTAQLASACAAMRRCAERDDPRGSLYASFPGHPLAVTFLRVHPGGWSPGPRGARTGAAWTTVHVYPESGQRVHTRTEVQDPTASITSGTVPGRTRFPSRALQEKA